MFGWRRLDVVVSECVVCMLGNISASTAQRTAADNVFGQSDHAQKEHQLRAAQGQLLLLNHRVASEESHQTTARLLVCRKIWSGSVVRISA